MKGWEIMDKKYIKSTTVRSALPRSERLRQSGGGGSSSTVVLGESVGNVFNKFLRKDIDDTAHGVIKFLQGIQFGTGDNAVCLRWDSVNQAIYVARANGDTANFYAKGNISAYGIGSTSGGGSLSANVLAYNDAVNLSSEDLSKVASAYSVAKLKQLIGQGGGVNFN